MARGGYRAPESPAPISGPGALSKRTDVQAPMPMTGGPYGEAQEMAAIQSGADMFAAPGPAPLTAPTMRPDEPVTAGAAIGPGPGPEALGQAEMQRNELSGLGKYLPMMEAMAGRQDAPRAFRALVSYVKALS